MTRKENKMDFKQITKMHKLWVDTAGESGEQLNLDETDMHGLILDPQILEQGYFSSCDFSRMAFLDISFYQSEFYSCNFAEASFTCCDFRKTVLDYSDFSGSTFIKCKFSRSDAFKTKFMNCIFQDCSFVGFNLMESDLSNSVLTSIDLDEAYFDQTIMTHCQFVNSLNVKKANHISILINDNLISGNQAQEWIEASSANVKDRLDI